MGLLQNAAELLVLFIQWLFKWVFALIVPCVLMYAAASLALELSLPLALGIAFGVVVVRICAPTIKRIEEFFDED